MILYLDCNESIIIAFAITVIAHIAISAWNTWMKYKNTNGKES